MQNPVAFLSNHVYDTLEVKSMGNLDEVHAKIIISEGSEGGQPGTPPMLVGPTLSLNMPVVPTALSFNVAVLILGVNFSTPRKLKLLITPDGQPENIIFQLAGNLPAFESPKGTMAFNFAVHNAVFHNAGTYQASISIDDKEIVSDTFITIDTGIANGNKSND